MSWTKPTDLAAYYPLPGALHWLVGRRVEGGVEITAGGVERREGATPAVAKKIASRHVARGGVIAPVDARAALVTLPALSESELAQGMAWELEKRFRLADFDPVYDYEPLSEGSASLLIGLKRSGVAPFDRWAAELRPERMEPAASAAFRFLRHWLGREDGARTLACVLQDDGVAAIAVTRGHVPLLFRPLIRGDMARPFDGEAGSRRLRETLLAVEDRHPTLEIGGLCAFGSFAPGVLENLASDCQLSLLSAPAPPQGAPADLVEAGTIFTLFGGMLGFP